MKSWRVGTATATALLSAALLAGCTLAWHHPVTAPHTPGGSHAAAGTHRGGQTGSVRRLQTPAFTPASVAFYDRSDGILTGALRAVDGRCPAGLICPAALLKAAGRRSVGVVATTADAGHTWRVRLFRRGPAYGSATIHAGSAWVTAGSCARDYCLPHGAGLLSSTDRGRTWTLISKAPVADPRFGSLRQGLALLDLARDNIALRLVTTSDGGRHWRAVSNPCPRLAADPQSLSMLNARTGWLLCGGEPATDLQEKALLRTDDGGRSWRTVSDTPTPGSASGPVRLGGLPTVGYGAGIFFVSALHGWLWAERGVLSATVDGGRRWAQVSHIVDPDVTAIGSAWFLPDRVGYAVLFKNSRFQLIRTADNGVAWTVVRSWRPA